MTTLEILRATRERLSDPARWCSVGVYDWRGGYCLMGTMGVVAKGNSDSETRSEAAETLRRVIGCVGVGGWNDDPKTTHADVLRVLDCAIANEEAREQEFTGDLIIDTPVGVAA